LVIHHSPICPRNIFTAFVKAYTVSDSSELSKLRFQERLQNWYSGGKITRREKQVIHAKSAYLMIAQVLKAMAASTKAPLMAIA
jgi:hypothetical protein